MTWSKGGEAVTSNGRATTSNYGTTLIIGDVRTEDAGPYTCTGSNDAGSASVATNLAVEGRD